MTAYEQTAQTELKVWQKKMLRQPSFLDRKTRTLQQKVNSYIPDKIHTVITTAIKQMIRAVLFGSVRTTAAPQPIEDLLHTELLIRDKIRFYTRTAAAEGSITGMGGILLGLADFPLFLSIKIKMLSEIATLYGHDIRELNERIFMLHIFQLAFSSQQHRRELFLSIMDWDSRSPGYDPETFDWKRFQQEYRDHIDLAKLAQLLPGIGAVVGFVVNERLTRRLGEYAMNAYRMRLPYGKNTAAGNK